MDIKFYEKLEAFLKDKKQILIPTAEKYDNMVLSIQKTGDQLKNLSKEETKWIRRYSIRIENGNMVLYHHGETVKEESQQLVKREQLFELLRTTHLKLGHAGRDCMWHDLRNYYGISK